MRSTSVRRDRLLYCLSLGNANRLHRSSAERKERLAFAQRLTRARFGSWRRRGTFDQHLRDKTLALSDAFDFDRHGVHCLLERSGKAGGILGARADVACSSSCSASSTWA